MTLERQEVRRGLAPPSESPQYRGFVGRPENYDLIGALQFNLLTSLGLREHHSLLDIGCGSLRGGKLFLSYLLPGRYFGIEPEDWLIQAGIGNEVGNELINIKHPVFSNDCNFTLSIFEQKFDFLLAQSILSHASPSQIRRCLSEARAVMKPTSIFAATFLQGTENYAGDTWVYPGCVTYTLQYMKSRAEEQGLVCKRVEWPHPAHQTWVVIVHPGNKNAVTGLSDVNKLAYLEDELRFHRGRLAKIEGHPYVRLGLRVYRILRRLKYRTGAT